MTAVQQNVGETFANSADQTRSLCPSLPGSNTEVLLVRVGMLIPTPGVYLYHHTFALPHPTPINNTPMHKTHIRDGLVDLLGGLSDGLGRQPRWPAEGLLGLYHRH